MAAKNRVTTNLDEKDFQDLMVLSNKLNVSMSWLGRRAFSDLLQKYREEESLGIINGAENINKFLLNKK